MTLTNTVKEPTEFDFPLETASPSFPPVDDAISYLKSIDWVDVRRRAIKGLNNVGLVIAILGEKTYEFGCFLGHIGEIDDSQPVDYTERDVEIYFGSDYEKDVPF